MALTLRNPHSILAVLQKRPQDVYEVRPPTSPNEVWRKVLDEAGQIGIAIGNTETIRSRGKGRRAEGRKQEGGRGGGGEASVREKAANSLDDIFDDAEGLRIAVDHLQDPRNLGSIFRTGAFFGVRSLVLTRDRSAPLSDTVYDTASGGVEYVPYSIQTNMRRTLQEAKDRGFWILGTSEHAATDLDAVPTDRRWLVVFGNEESGLRRLILETCDEVCRIPPSSSELTSLNVSAAASIVMQKLAR